MLKEDQIRKIKKLVTLLTLLIKIL